jgi:transcriptional regulator with XRE-family HTH domain
VNAAEIVRRARQIRGWTQTELARAAGIAQSTVARWESGRVSPRVGSLERVLEATGLQARVELVEDDRIDWDQLFERLSWAPIDRLRYLTDMIAFEERALKAREV